ncbi:hypothetical protein [Methanocaldococcus villosus]|uniref:hypothetical protein n=1 Tax=Methanocaldococcus villosus TaxID=667126 RepID=UPI001F19ECE4|nr:hypothetical protein [Methanocaldococcus villosus]
MKRLGVIELFKISYDNGMLTMIYASLLSQIISNVPTLIYILHLIALVIYFIGFN